MVPSRHRACERAGGDADTVAPALDAVANPRNQPQFDRSSQSGRNPTREGKIRGSQSHPRPERIGDSQEENVRARRR